MLEDLFSGRAEDSRNVSVASSVRQSARQNQSARRTAAVAISMDPISTHSTAVTTAADRRLFVQCVEQVQRQLKPHINSPSTLHTIASYYTRVEPYVEGRPFCVSLSYATFIFHIQMARVSDGDVQLYVQLISAILAQIPDDAQLTHPFVQRVLRDAVFGLPSPTCLGGAHCVVLVPPLQYRAFATLAAMLAELGVVPVDILYQWQDRLEAFCSAQSPLVANRALTLLVRTVGGVRADEQITALQHVLRSKPNKMNVDFLLACYERLRRSVPDAARGPTYGRALSIHCSELFLRFRSPIRREYVERFLYPSLAASDMQSLVQIPATRQHLCEKLLQQCTLGMVASNPYYLCLCAIMQNSFNHEMEGAVEVVELIHCQMPHAAYFMATLAIDTHMSVAMFAKVVIALARGAGLAMAGRDANDDVAAALKNRTNVYNVLFLLREVVRSCSVTASRRASDMLKALCVAMPLTTLEALGKLSIEAFGDDNDAAENEAAVDPQLLCAEVAMVLHQEHIGDAMDAAIANLRDATAVCIFCGAGRGAAALCPVNRTMHMAGQRAVDRVLATLAECAGMAAVESKFVHLLRGAATQMDNAVHILLFHILANAGQHRHTLFTAVEPYIRSTLTALAAADRASPTGLITSEQKANVLMLHVKIAILFASSIDPTYLESILKIFCEVRLRNNHDALALWYMGNVLLRYAKGNVELLPTDPTENNYCVEFPNCAPSCRTTADNAQLILKILDRSHGFSAEMRKLVGCCVCKLIQDFNVQAPNIIGTLLSSFGFVPVGLHAVAEYALPVGAGSAFWSFFLHQMRTSAPARTAFVTALAKAMSQRFRIATPADAVIANGPEATGHLFAVMMYEAMKRNAPLTRVVLHMVSQWTKQPQHPPGRFACLMYICVQLVAVVASRGEGPEAVEREAETRQDASQFTDAVRKAVHIVRAQMPRLVKLAPLVRHENPQFFQLLRRLHGKAARTVAEVTGTPCNDTAAAAEAFDDTAAEFGNTAAQSAFTAEGANSAPHVGASLEVIPHNETSVYNDYYNNNNDNYNGNDINDDDNVFDSFGPDDSADHYRYPAGDGEGPALPNAVASASGAAPLPPPPPPLPLPRAQPATSFVTHAERSSAVTSPSTIRSLNTSANVDLSANVNTSANGNANASAKTSTSTSVRRRPREVSFADDSDGVSAFAGSEGLREHEHPQRTRRMHKGTATSTIIIDSAPRFASHAVQTSPLERLPPVQAAPSNISAHVSANGRTGDAGHAMGLPVEEEKRHMEEDAEDDEESVWHEPDFADDYGDEIPIDDTTLPSLQAVQPRVDGHAVPSSLVLEYLRTHQGSQSILHELQQLERELNATGAVASAAMGGAMNHYHMPHNELTAPVAPPHTTILPVTMEGRPNNYSAPHLERTQAPSKTVIARLNMIQTIDRTMQMELHTATAAVDEAASPSKRHRLDDGKENGTHNKENDERSGRKTPRMPTGAQFFLQQNATSVMKDINGMRQQQAAIASITTPDRLGVVPANLPPTTPYGQVVLPQCFVEQKNDTAVREVRQVMGTHNPNDARLSTGGKRRVRLSGLSGGGGETENSAAWWAETSSAPMPQYALDPQYSLELF